MLPEPMEYLIVCVIVMFNLNIIAWFRYMEGPEIHSPSMLGGPPPKSKRVNVNIHRAWFVVTLVAVTIVAVAHWTASH